ncbi:poly(A) polymerase [Streptomyces sp. NPDC006175]|uniref:poly(A) polymerase n=1 Tax=Streptomyces sp. NPDC006175 TaxID=3154471 RepID=UPI00339EB051
MRTSEEIYHRIRWDARFDMARFSVGVAQRGRDPKRVPLERFTPGGDIPWHRVLFFEADGEVVWDRSTGLDRIDASEAGRVRAPRRLPSPYFTSRVPHAFSPATGTWEPASPGPPDPSASLTVLTWNTLWDRYDSDRIDTARRRPLLLDALGAANADVIALQEVEPALLRLLLDCAWVRDGYVVATGRDHRDVADNGLLLLSRLPVSEAGLHVLGPHKAVTAAVVETTDGPVTVAVTHLSSDHSPEGATRRDTELADLAAGLAAIEGELLLVGDFNDGGDRPQTRLAMTDAWSQVHGPADLTPTFDPSVNPLAAVSSLSGRVSRLDRVLLRTERLRARSAALTGETPGPEGLYISDHYGVRMELGPPLPVAEESEGVTERVAAALPGARVHVVGSRRMGCALPGADLDLVAALPGAPDPADVRRRLAAALPEARNLREVSGARVPGLRWHLDGLRVDLVTVATDELSPAEAVDRRAELGEAAAIALSAVSDADAVLGAAEPHRDAFASLARDVKAWAAARGLDSAPCGGLPGLTWAVLAARTAHEAGDLPPLALLRHFFATWAVWDWDEAVGGVAATASPVTVLTPTAPVRSCTTQVSAAGRDLLAAELYRAWEIAESVDDPRPLLCAPPSLPELHPSWALASVPTDGPDEGRLRGRLLALTAALAEAGATDCRIWPRPLTAGGRTGYAIGLGTTPPPAHRLAEIGAGVLRGIRDASLAPVRI